jgi:uncharacterized protein
MTEVFLDTSYAVAYFSTRDEFHAKALELSKRLDNSDTRLVTTQAVMIEIANALSKAAYRQAAIIFLEALETSPSVDIVAISQDLFDKAFQLYKSRLDKEWGLTDCMSFVVMSERKITDALTTDRHFSQAGFSVLLRGEGGNNG